MQTKPLLILINLLTSIGFTAAQQTLTETILHDGKMREYIVYIPTAYDGNTPFPLMFNFHGYTGNANGHMNSTRMRAVADDAGFIIVYPQGSLFFNNTHWNVGSWTRGSTANDLGFTEAMIDAVATNLNIDLNRVYSCGYSNGGYFSFELACQLSDRIAAIGSVGGKMSSETFNSCDPSHPIPVITIHGTADNVVSYYGSIPVGSKSIDQVNAYWKSFNNTDAEATMENMPNIVAGDGSTVEYYSYGNGNNCVAVDHYKVIGGGHDWPGAWGNRDIDASSVIWNFVSQYDINGLINCSITSTGQTFPPSREILLYPNPAETLITIKTDLLKIVDCQLFSATGKSVLSRKVGPGNQTIDVSDLPSGVYYLRLGNRTAKLIKTN